VRRTVKKTARIPAGVDTGMRVRLPGEGDAGVRGGKPGDLYIITHVKSHPLFERRGDDVYMEISVSMAQAALGASVDVPTLYGKTERVKLLEGTQHGQVYSLRGCGMPNPNGHGRGDQHVVVKVETPTRLSEEERKLLTQFAELRGEKLDVVEDKGFFDKVKDVLGGL